MFYFLIVIVGLIRGYCCLSYSGCCHVGAWFPSIDFRSHRYQRLLILSIFKFLNATSEVKTRHHFPAFVQPVRRGFLSKTSEVLPAITVDQRLLACIRFIFDQ